MLLSPLNFKVTQNDVYTRCQAGTGQWFLDLPDFKDWLSGGLRTLWCPGIRMWNLAGDKSLLLKLWS